MAERPRQHILETESKRVFDSVIPLEWVIRPHEPDYGVDREIQIFENGNTTPYLFFVQLKATDKITELTEVISYPFSTKRLIEYFNYPLPVLLVLFDATSKRLFYKWSHNLFDELNSVEKTKIYTKESFTVKFENELDSNKLSRLVREVKEYFYVRGIQPENLGDITVNIKLNLNENIANGLVGQLKDWTWEIQNSKFVKFISSEDADIVIEGITEWKSITVITKDEKIAFPFFEIDNLKDKKLTEAVLSTLKIILAEVLAFNGRLNLSLELITKFFVEDYVMTPTIQYLLERGIWISIFAEKNKSLEALEISERLIDKGFIGLSTLFAVSINATNLNKNIKINKYQSILRKIIKLTDNKTDQGTQSYNLANSLRGSNNFREAIIFYCRAAKLESTYKSKFYWWSELAGCFFLIGKLNWAENCYRKAIEIGDENYHLNFLLADTLLHKGKFKRALECLDIYLKEIKIPYSEAVLKKWLVEFLLLKFGVEVKRDTTESEILVLEAINTEDTEKQGRIFEKALFLDPLSELAWRNYAVYEDKEPNKNSFRNWLISSILNVDDGISWTMTILLLFSELDEKKQKLKLFQLAVINEAWNSSNLIEDTIKSTISEKNPDLINQLINKIKITAENAKWNFEQKRGILVRIN